VGGGLSFLAANLGALELMGWAAPPISTASWPRTVLDRRHPAMLFLGIVMMPFYYISKTTRAGYLQLRYGESSRGLAPSPSAS